MSFIFDGRGLTASEMLRGVDYMGVLDVQRAHAGFTNVVTNVSYVIANEEVYGNIFTKSDQCRSVPPKMNIVVLMNDFGQEFSLPGQVEMEAFLGDTFYSAGGPIAGQELEVPSMWQGYSLSAEVYSELCGGLCFLSTRQHVRLYL